jgi:hypothetical protein
MRMMRRFSVLRWGGTVASLGLLAACGFGRSGPAAAARPRPRPAPQTSAATKALAGMVDAVGPSRLDAPVNLKFIIRERPQVGQDDVIDYAVIPQAVGVERVGVVFNGVDDLTITNHGPELATVKPASGVPMFGSITIQPAKAGLYTLTAVVAVQSPDRSVVWPFSIPIIAAPGPSPAQAAAGPP